MKTTFLDAGWLFADLDIPNGEAPDCVESGWLEVALPHDWAISRPFNEQMREGSEQGFFDRWGIGWYRRHLKINDFNPERVYRLKFDGVHELCTVWINGSLVASHKYGSSGFCADAGPYLKKGENLIAVRVDNTAGPADRWYSGAGIHRRVCLVETEKNHFRGLDSVVKTSVLAGGAAQMRVSAAISADSSLNPKITAALYDANMNEEARGVSSDGFFTFRIANAQLWSPDNPYLYDLALSLSIDGEEADRVEIKVGIRDIVFDLERGMLSNGKPEKLKGVCLHQEFGGAGIAAGKALMKQRLSVLKSIGCNAIRTSHNIPSSEFMDLCDEMGFYVIEELTDKWTTGSYGRFFKDEWKNDLEFMIKRDRNRPSVVMWSVGNEVDAQGSKSMLEILEMLVKAAKSMDSRPVTCAMSPHYTNAEGIEVIGADAIVPVVSKIASYVDILGLNYQEQWYNEIHDASPDKLIAGTEIFSFFKGSRENCFNFTAENPWVDVQRNDWAIGGFLWAGADYLGESAGYPSKGWCSGLLRRNNERKPISWLFESYWSDGPVVRIAIVDYTLRNDMVREPWSTPPLSFSWDFPTFASMPLPYMIFTNCEEVKLALRDRSYDLKKPSECESGIITGYLPHLEGAVIAEGFINGEKVCEHILRAAGPASKLVFASFEKAGENQQMLLSVYSVDSNGEINALEHAEVEFSVCGNGKIESAFSGDMLSNEPFNSNKCKLFEGAASVIIRTGKAQGSILIKASSPGLEPAEAEVLFE
ncbi:MAG: glycoside hydrolase family 2 protein [Clostridiales bacterium]|jgi:beta-galactosidase|nr:glycoside hydrolase family 2 protein [Clostridiales bacterium]